MTQHRIQTTFGRRTLLTGAGLVTATAALAACGNNNNQSGGPSGGPTTGAAPVNTAGTIDNDGVLTIGAAVATSNVFPQNFNVFGGGDSAPGNALFWETLFRISSQNGSELVPNLAESVVYSEDGKVATYTLRQGVTWNDGKPFTSKDVAFTYGFIFEEPNPEPRENGTYAWLAKAIEAPDEHTVIITYNEPQFVEDLPLSLYFPIYPEHIYSQVDRPNYLDKEPVGTGPGKLKAFAGQLITIDIRDDYWGDKPAGVKQVQIVPSGTAGNIESQLTQGKVDWSEGGAPGVVTDFVKMDDHNGYAFFPDGSTRGIIMATHALPTSDLAVRTALRDSVDMGIVATAGRVGYTVPSVTGLDPIIYASMLKPEYKDALQPNIEAAKKALEDAGWTVQNGNLTKDGKEYPLMLHIQNDNPIEMSTMPIVVDQWKKNLGVDILFTPLPKEVFGPMQAKGECMLSLWTTNAAGGAFQAFTMYMHTKIYDIGNDKADGNYGRWKMPDEANDAIMGITRTPADQTDKITEYCQVLQTAVANDAPYIPVQNNGAGGMYSTKKWSGLKAAADIDYFPRVGGYNNMVRTVRDFAPSKA